MMDWDSCSAVAPRPGKVSGAWVFAGTRVPLSSHFEYLAGVATVQQLLDWIPWVEERQVREVLEYEAKALKASVLRLAFFFTRRPSSDSGSESKPGTAPGIHD